MEDDETFWHFATNCPVLRREREEVFLGRDIEGGDWNAGNLLQFADITKIAMTLEGYDGIWYGSECDVDTDDDYAPRPDPEPD
jgi:hypothetical protein